MGFRWRTQSLLVLTYSGMDMRQYRPEERGLRTSLEETGKTGWVSRMEDLGYKTAT